MQRMNRDVCRQHETDNAGNNYTSYTQLYAGNGRNKCNCFLLVKDICKSQCSWLFTSCQCASGSVCIKRQTLFIIKTKEAEALGNTINNIDSSLHFEGTIKVTAPGSGYVTQLTYTAGNYVQDGEQLAEITDTKSFAFILDLPYELKPYLSLNQ